MTGKYCHFLVLLWACVSQGYAAESISACREAVSVAERQAGIPSRLLDAISRVESGRRSPDGNTVIAWPWTINAAGHGYFYASKDEAVEAVQAFQQQGVVSIDVGCMQINLHHHPDAFRSLEDAFDPEANARYGARFLTDLFERLHGWEGAIAAYHSLTPALGAEYERHVMAIWHGQPDNYRPPDFLPQVIMTANGPQVIMPSFSSSATFPKHGASFDPRMLPDAAAHVPRVVYGPPPRIIRHDDRGQGMFAGNGHGGRDLASYRAHPIHLAW
ncbi:lytic transglycosylase domain-containing protein [Gluconobacter morbifer]|uniref:Transglycosylase SLT domain-containing protein n=1 Tax=Gluconobacter morbifer G707 TaxID=1088869 RepID=G6XHZ2_9PROT|nr:lytic transglycosylase domain-containing protein [Gluconobacter morbifer]EHH68432.1 hypothetical protein GMO_12020 [Gluconobacter morbifer G707]